MKTIKSNINIGKSVMYAVQGAIVGIGAILPGISGGVLCVAFGLFEPIMELLTHPKESLKKNKDMLVPFIIGWVLGFILLAKVVEVFFSFAPDVAIFLFFGLVCGTIPDMFKHAEESNRSMSWTPFIMSLSASYIFFHIIEAGELIDLPENFLTFMFCGVLWGLSLIVPGLSSSTLLIYLGLFEPLTEGISSLDITVLFPFVIGISATVVLLAKFVNMLFKQHYALISRIILGFVISTSLKTLPHNFSSVWSMIISVACCALGFLIAILMDKADKKTQRNTEKLPDAESVNTDDN